ncbi:hypothetical protein GYMLUDRAFT_966858 [Collybiopsis luxurians FD-317 M1]|uniref:C2H2-type domain-containing protein n=1 Tax=Collybiopsis luxurians FD-317 M1 TaxID=944289 RepID=A0A0D0BSD0_9AGAR|nr:hypothetical protein GYMLUDRAFT_966858 [Collybiopsis luxurians FD-317 M1]
MHRCPYPNCEFQNLQRTNVNTHIRTHTQDKNQKCPDCAFCSVDPASLTRHRKRIHGYIPRRRRTPASRQIKPKALSDSVKSSQNPATESGCSRSTSEAISENSGDESDMDTDTEVESMDSPKSEVSNVPPSPRFISALKFPETSQHAL